MRDIYAVWRNDLGIATKETGGPRLIANAAGLYRHHGAGQHRKMLDNVLTKYFGVNRNRDQGYAFPKSF
jgi:hypothetical protein